MAGKSRRAVLEAGAEAPGFALRDLEGKTKSLSDVLESGPALLAFYKISCPVCQMTLPYLDRLKDNGKVRIVSISQDDAKATREFMKHFQVDVPTLLDEESAGYPASNDFGITHVPTLFQVEPDGRISHAWSGFSKADMEALAERAGKPVFREGEQVPVYRPG